MSKFMFGGADYPAGIYKNSIVANSFLVPNGVNFRPPADYKYECDDKVYETEDELPRIDVKKWAKNIGLEVSEDGNTLTCYKAVYKKDGKYFSIYDSSFFYEVGSYAIAEDLDLNQNDECSSGLHGTTLPLAHEYGLASCDTKAFLELKVDISDPDNFVIPYNIPFVVYDPEKLIRVKPSDKIRFKKCYVVREVKVEVGFIDKETGKIHYRYSE